MKKLIFLPFVFIILCSVVYAQVNIEHSQTIETSTSPDFEAKLIQRTQNPANKTIIFIMEIHSNIKSDRVLINWEIKGEAIITDTYPQKGILIVAPENTYNIPIEIKPGPDSVVELYGKAEAFLVDGTKITTVRKNFLTNSESEILPLTEEYLKAKRKHQIITLIRNIAITVTVLILTGFGVKKFLNYLKRDDVAAFNEKFQEK
jgi:hypothetical protein